MGEKETEIRRVTIEFGDAKHHQTCELIIHPPSQTVTVREFFPSGQQRNREAFLSISEALNQLRMLLKVKRGDPNAE